MVEESVSCTDKERAGGGVCNGLIDGMGRICLSGVQLNSCRREKNMRWRENKKK